MDSKALYRKYFKRMPDDSIHFLGEKLIIQIPEGFVERGITKIIQTTVNTIGIFEGYISDNVDEEDVSKFEHKFVMKLPSSIFLNPSHIEKVSRMVEDIETDTMKKENLYNFIFMYDDVFIKTSILVQDFQSVDSFCDMLLNGKFPDSIRYDELPPLWAKCAEINGSKNLKTDFNTLAMIVSNLIRDPENFSDPFRLVYDKYYNRGVYMGKRIMYRDIPRYISNFTAITGSDPRFGVTVSMEKTKGQKKPDTHSPVEDMIM